MFTLYNIQYENMNDVAYVVIYSSRRFEWWSYLLYLLSRWCIVYFT